MANCLKITINNVLNTIEFSDSYGNNTTVTTNNEANMCFINGIVQAVYDARYFDCDSVSIYNQNTYIGCIESDIKFNSSTVDFELLSKAYCI